MVIVFVSPLMFLKTKEDIKDTKAIPMLFVILPHCAFKMSFPLPDTQRATQEQSCLIIPACHFLHLVDRFPVRAQPRRMSLAFATEPVVGTLDVVLRLAYRKSSLGAAITAATALQVSASTLP